MFSEVPPYFWGVHKFSENPFENVLFLVVKMQKQGRKVQKISASGGKYTKNVLKSLIFNQSRRRRENFWRCFLPPEGRENFSGGTAKSKKKTLMTTIRNSENL